MWKIWSSEICKFCIYSWVVRAEKPVEMLKYDKSLVRNTKVRKIRKLHGTISSTFYIFHISSTHALSNGPFLN